MAKRIAVKKLLHLLNIAILSSLISTNIHSVSIQSLIDRREIPQVKDGALNLSRKKIDNLAGLMNIPGIETVVWLNLSDNELATVGANSFHALPLLSQLYLDGNKIQNINPEGFAGVENLNILWLQNNGLISIPPDAFGQEENNIKFLRLDNNKLQTIPISLFNYLKNLESLELEKNPLSFEEKIKIESTARINGPKHLKVYF